MQREIKFRGWNTETKLFELPLYRGVANLNVNDILAGSTLVYQQFTGLKDKNGKEIYEGDILKTFRGVAEVGFNHGCFVLWYEGIKNWKLIERTGLVNHGGADKHEIIGNIYENPELLSDKGPTSDK